MIIILALLTIGIIITLASWINQNGCISAGIACSIVFTLICGMIWGGTYKTYLENRSFYSATKEQYHSAIEIYTDYAVIDMGRAAFTDLKYQGYQENIGVFIKDLRNKIIEYNTLIIGKRIMGKNPIFSWLIIEPDKDMVIIKMKSE